MGSGGGGGSSGMVSYPPYMMTWHATSMQLGTWESVPGGSIYTPSEYLSVSLTGAMNEALEGASPYAGFVGVDADDVMLGGGSIGSYSAPYDLLEAYSVLELGALITSFRTTNPLTALAADSTTMIDAIVAAESALLDSDINQNVLPEQQSGMRDVNAVMSSAFVVGESIIWSNKAKVLAKTDATLRFDGYKLQIDTVAKAEDLTMRQAVAKAEIAKSIVVMAGDYAKLYTTMRVDLDNNNLEIVAKDMLWDVKVFQYGGNFLGSIAGSAVSTDRGDQGSKAMGVASAVIGAAAASASLYSSISSAVASNATTAVASAA